MSLTSKQEVLDFWARNENAEAKEEKREIEALRKDIRTAQKYIKDALAQYRKKKLNTRSKAAANSAAVFAELEDYRSVEEIRDAYGWAASRGLQCKIRYLPGPHHRNDGSCL